MRIRALSKPVHDIFGDLIVEPPRPNCGHVSSTFTHDRARGVWLCFPCVIAQGITRARRCQRCCSRHHLFRHGDRRFAVTLCRNCLRVVRGA